MHLKKLLGRKRCRFVLLTSADQAADEIIQQFNACIDTALDDLELSAAAIQTISLQIHKSKAYPDHADLGAELLDTPLEENVQPKQYTSQFSPTDNAVLPAAAKPSDAETTPPPPAVAKGEPSLEEQGVVYTPKRNFRSIQNSPVLLTLPFRTSIHPSRRPVTAIGRNWLNTPKKRRG
jgi:hypothetical protein